MRGKGLDSHKLWQVNNVKEGMARLNSVGPSGAKRKRVDADEEVGI